MSVSTLPVQALEEYDPSVPMVLPHDKVYSIQVGYKLFRLSGLSLSSDSPSYFTKFFGDKDNEEKVLFFDRSPQIFEKIYNHLQGYSINVTNDYEYMHVWSDAFFFGLKKLQKLMTEQDIFASIGDQSFKIPKVLLQNEGNCPNFFTMNSERLYFDNVAVIERNNMLRPPPQRPPIVAGRSPKLFADLLEYLRGNTLIVKNEEHRRLLQKEARYYRFLELEQRMVNHKVVNDSIIINLMDLSKKGMKNVSPSDRLTECPMRYSRPYVDEPARELIFQIDHLQDVRHAELFLNKRTEIPTVKFQGKLYTKITQVFKDLFEGLIQENNTVTFLVGLANSRTTINGKEMSPGWVEDLLSTVDKKPAEEESKAEEEVEENAQKKRKLNLQGYVIKFYLKRSMWKLMMRGTLARLEAVNLEGVTSPVQRIDFI
ncbi:BTB/POZ domain family protein [Candida parapsilosis]|uniref:BTB/POZ domain family protein n=1 Tax=Candida parapsilosis TaxID=5480 RepID=A0A8X7NI27_CANPA|nr:BTB/POZ domain family protein [Candida parapsilosis]KAF6047306.1 BTB/POZ domain family protein [Candida parapsilosis]KAF6050723.1 BTB/POZ domain family protein [Candida parapsilosis]KAF6061842.1 BTB/POZ domain family protein [Candida parapsilosis]KAI5905742.1 Uncharacterized protein K4G60_g5012 [Candida parapsilosis]